MRAAVCFSLFGAGSSESLFWRQGENAFVELFEKYFKAKHSDLLLWKWHLDHIKPHRRTYRPVWNLSSALSLSRDDYEDYLEFPFVNAILSNRLRSLIRVHEVPWS